MSNSEIMVSITCLAYNHERYIRQCLEGFVKQKTNFKFEVLVHDDASTDKTADIIREYEAKYPEIIKPIYQKQNQKSQGVNISKTFQIPRAKGKYFSWCEGDDYWNDENKLQRQFDIMEANPDCVLCTHKVQCVNEDGTKADRVYPQFELKEGIYSKDEFVNILLSGRAKYPFHTSSYFCKTQDIRDFHLSDIPIEFIQIAKVGDVPLMLYWASLGSVYYIDEALSNYRLFSVGSWSNRMKGRDGEASKIRNIIDIIKSYDEYTNHKYHEMIEQTIRRSEFELARITKDYKDYTKRKYWQFYKEVPVKERVYFFLNAYFPKMMNLLLRKESEDGR